MVGVIAMQSDDSSHWQWVRATASVIACTATPFMRSQERPFNTMWNDERAVSEGVGWIMASGIMLIVILAASFQGYVIFASASATHQSDQAEFLSERIASGIEGVDREVRSTSSQGRIEDRIGAPNQIAGDNYNIKIESTSTGGAVVIQIPGEGTVAKTEFYSQTTVASTTIDSGEIAIVRERGATEIVVRKAN
jgi:hypothetical protein